MPASPPLSDQISNVACPFCGLVCDDLVIGRQGGRLTVLSNGCPISRPAFERSGGAMEPRIAGRPATSPDAIAEAARLLRAARVPLISGLGTDVAGTRAAASLADRIGATLDHMNSAAAMRNLMVLQDGGWVTTTLSEVRNRADLLIIAGSDIAGRFPRFFERCIANQQTLFDEKRSCEIIILGKGLPEGVTLPGPAPTVIPCDPTRLHEAAGMLRLLGNGFTAGAASAAGVPLETWKSLADRMKSARYGVLAWAAADFGFPHAELTVQALAELIKDLNKECRWSGLPLGGSEGDITADMVLLWQTGFATRTSYGQGHPEHDPYHLSGERMLARGEVDALLWISSFNPERIPPDAKVPRIVLGHPAMTLAQEPEVFIPVGTPGVDHAGHMFRSDRVVALSLGRLRESTLPSTAEVLGAIESAL
jgi:formylmethanofuran dehydrogenase subunit B